MPQRIMQQIMMQSFSTEILYSFVIIICSLMIYFGTKELYELSSHRGIKFFRQAFLFFALAYFFRSFIKLILFYFNAQGIFAIPPRMLNPFISQLTLILFIYFSAMAMFCLIYSVAYKNFDYRNNFYLFHILAIVLSVLSVLFRNIFSYLILNIILLAFVIIAVFISYKNSKRKTKGINLYTIYVLLLFFWILNIIDILIPKFLQSFQMLIYLISSGLFLLMLYKVLKKAGSD